MPRTPLVIPPSDHPITVDLIDPEALFVLRKLNQAGFSSYLVGGGVRDLYLGKPPKDFDISTDARPGQIRRLFSNSRTIGRRFRLVQVFFKNNKVIEVSTLRSLSEHDLDGPEAMLAPNNTYGTLDQDALRRDLSINALFFEIENQTIIDHVGGVEDLDKSIIRIIGDPNKRVNRDPVRMLRAIRHSARNNFTIEPLSWQAVCANPDKLSLCPPSRLRDELLKDLYGGAAAAWFSLAVPSGIFTRLFSLYRTILPETLPDGKTCQEKLASLFSTIDRCNHAAVAAGAHRQHDFFLFSLILVPWAEIQFDLFNRTKKGPQQFHLAKQMRAELDETIGPELNLKRLSRQEITTLLTHLPLLNHQQNANSWPKWLKRKSYFPKCRLLYYFYREAVEGIPVPDDFLLASRNRSTSQPKNPSATKNSRRKGRPAFSNKRRGGVFGFKR